MLHKTMRFFAVLSVLVVRVWDFGSAPGCSRTEGRAALMNIAMSRILCED